MTSEELLAAYAEGKRNFGGANLHGANLGSQWVVDQRAATVIFSS